MKQFLQLDKYIYLLDHGKKIYFLHSAHSSGIMKKKMYLELDIPESQIYFIALCPWAA